MLFNFNQGIHQHNNNLRGKVEHVDEDQTEGDEEDNSGRDDVGGDEEGDPAHGDEHSRGKVDTENEGSDGSGQLDLKSVHAVVA